MKDAKRNATGRLKSLLLLFITMLKIGLFTFGGGYAMIHLLENEFVSKKKWIEEDEFIDLVAIAESTPGPIAINCSTYIGYKKEKILGAVLATLGMCIPSFTIIFLISLFFNQFLSIGWVASAFKGIQVCVVFLILSAGVKMLKKMKKKPFNLIVMSVTFLCMVAFSVFAVSFSSIFYILISGFVGLLIYLIGYFKSKKSPEQKEGEQ
jgi:chromate transporter